jgi:hypothetical protein
LTGRRTAARAEADRGQQHRRCPAEGHRLNHTPTTAGSRGDHRARRCPGDWRVHRRTSLPLRVPAEGPVACGDTSRERRRRWHGT